MTLLNIYTCDICYEQFSVEEPRTPFQLTVKYPTGEEEKLDCCPKCADATESLRAHPIFFRKFAEALSKHIKEFEEDGDFEFSVTRLDGMITITLTTDKAEPKPEKNSRKSFAKMK
jgi:hypothetical protein